jgi:serine/threonine protein kinase
VADETGRLMAALADRYRIERELGQGGMASVYRACDLRHQSKVALKVMRPELAAVIGADRFLTEITTTANLQHPHIRALFDSGSLDSSMFYVMPSRHQAENILLHGGHALVDDFGKALAAARTSGSRMTETGMSLGSPTYMSSEQAMAERTLDARADIYALGCVLYEMACGLRFGADLYPVSIAPRHRKRSHPSRIGNQPPPEKGAPDSQAQRDSGCASLRVDRRQPPRPVPVLPARTPAWRARCSA